MRNRLAVVIPTQRPSAGLVDLVAELAGTGFGAIVIVDDGSGPEYRAIFDRAAAFPGVHLLRHAVRLGRGAALKAGLNHVLCAIPDLAGVVTADAGGQYRPEDIDRVAATLVEYPGSLVLGARSTSGDAPLRSKLFRAALGGKLADPLTTLRGIPASLLPSLLRLEPAGPKFELEIVLAARRLSLPIIEQPVNSPYAPPDGPGPLTAVFARLRQQRLATPFALALAAVFIALLGFEIHGLRTNGLFAQYLWDPAGLRRFERYTEVFTVFSAVLLFAAPRYYAAVLAAILAVLTAMAVGPVPLLATAFFFVSANALGTRLLFGRSNPPGIADQLCATLLGTGLYTLLLTLLARAPVNYPAVWGAILAAPLLLDLRGVRERGAAWLSLLRPPTRPTFAARAGFAVLAFVLTAHWVVALKPEIGADSLAMHLAIPANIGMYHKLTFEPARFLWAVMPMAADFAYSIVYVLGGEYASRLLVFAMLLAVCALLYSALRRWTTPAAACLLTAAFAATPIVQLVTGSMFVENFLAAMILGIVTAIWRLGDTGERRYFYLAMALAGTAMAVKFGALAFVAMALPFAFLEARRHSKSLGGNPRAVYALGIVLLLAIAAPPYAIAYLETGNPLYPYLNGKFHSKLLPRGFEIVDERFSHKLDLRTPYDITFRTSRYYEGQDGSLGFHYLVLVPLGLLGFAVGRRRPAVCAAVVAAGAGVVILSAEPNARYLYAAMPLALIPAGATLAWLAEHHRGLYRTLLAYTVAAIALNAYFLPSASYYHKDFTMPQPFSRAARERYVAQCAPVRKVVGYLNRAHPKQPVLFTHESAHAGANGIVYLNHWHQATTFQMIRETRDVPGMLALMQWWNIRYFVSMKPKAPDLADPPVLADFLAACTLPEYEVGDYYLARLEPGCGAKNITEPVIVVPPGYYDADDPAFVFQGAWRHDSAVPGPDHDTRARTDAPGAAISFAFDGKKLYYLFSRGPDHGIATVTIDGVAQPPIDMYNRVTQWQRRAYYCCFQPGRHVIVIRDTGQKNPASTGYAIDVDSFSVIE